MTHPPSHPGDPTPMDRLRAATWPAHQRLEKGLDIKKRFGDGEAYRRHLEQMWGFSASIESSLDAQSFDGALPDYDARRKLPLLTRDLIALGTETGVVNHLPRCPGIPVMADAAAAFGVVYVLEGATLGGQVLLPVVQSRIGLTADHGAAFLASYGDRVGAMWQAFSTALNTACASPDEQATAVACAAATFDALSAWLNSAQR